MHAQSLYECWFMLTDEWVAGETCLLSEKKPGYKTECRSVWRLTKTAYRGCGRLYRRVSLVGLGFSSLLLSALAVFISLGAVRDSYLFIADRQIGLYVITAVQCKQVCEEHIWPTFTYSVIKSGFVRFIPLRLVVISFALFFMLQKKNIH